jgi:Actin
MPHPWYRLQVIALSFYGAELERITVVQTPKELDPRVIVWKGASILARLDTSSEFWVTAKDWVSIMCMSYVILLTLAQDRLGMRAFRDRSLFL